MSKRENEIARICGVFIPDSALGRVVTEFTRDT